MTVTYRRGTEADHFGVYAVFRHALHQLSMRLGIAKAEDEPKQPQLEEGYERFLHYLEHLTRTAAHFWVAEDRGDVVGYARSVQRGEVHQLAELFVRPEVQERGVGKRLMELAFAGEATSNRIIISSPDLRALSRYLKAGVRSRFTIYAWYGRPQKTKVETDLQIQPLSDASKTLATLNRIDRRILGYEREVDHRWLMQRRHGFLFRRKGRAAGYGYVSDRFGPVAMLRNEDFHAALAHLENTMVEEAGPDVELDAEVPMHNEAAVNYMLRRGFQTSGFFEHFMSERPLGQYDNYVFMDPPLIT